jgi:cation transport ATPase
MIADFRRRFWVSLVVSMPVLVLSPLIEGWLGLGEKLAFPGDRWVQAVLATVIYLYGGRPFLRGSRRRVATSAARHDYPYRAGAAVMAVETALEGLSRPLERQDALDDRSNHARIESGVRSRSTRDGSAPR